MPRRVFEMPDLGEGLEEGKIVAWLVAAGDEVELNQPLVEVETAKAAVEIPSPFAGRVVALHGEEGSDVPVGASLVTFEVVGSDTGGEPVGPGGVAAATGGARRVAATPPVRRLAKDLGIDLEVVSGTGPAGRVTEADVRAAAGPGSARVSALEAPFQAEEISTTRRAIAGRLTRVVREVPQVTTWRTVDCSALEALRSQIGVSPLAVFVRALADTLSRHPELNSSWDGDAGVIRRYSRVDVGLGVDTPDGLRTVTVRDAGAKSITTIAEEIASLAASARDGSVRLEDVVGSTITVSNTGSYGSESGTPILNPGEAVIVALGAIAPRALVVDGTVVARPAATISLTFDHRVLDGATVGRALTDLVTLLQSPEPLGELPR